MLGKKRVHRRRGISNLLVALILVAIAAVGGSFIFVSLYSQMQTMTRNASLQRRSLDIVSSTSGDLVSATIKNNGTVVLDEVRVKVINRTGDNVELLITGLSPGETGSDHGSGDFGIQPGRTYPVLITAKGPDGENMVSRATSVRARG